MTERQKEETTASAVVGGDRKRRLRSFCRKELPMNDLKIIAVNSICKCLLSIGILAFTFAVLFYTDNLKSMWLLILLLLQPVLVPSITVTHRDGNGAETKAD